MKGKSPGLIYVLLLTVQQTQPLEPILFPDLQIYFVDFTYLNCSIDQMLLTLETCFGYKQTWKALLYSNFQGLSGAHGTPHKVWCFTDHQTISPGNQIPLCQTIINKRELFPANISRVHLHYHACNRSKRVPTFWFGDFEPIYFKSMVQNWMVWNEVFLSLRID